VAISRDLKDVLANHTRTTNNVFKYAQSSEIVLQMVDFNTGGKFLKKRCLKA